MHKQHPLRLCGWDFLVLSLEVCLLLSKSTPVEPEIDNESLPGALGMYALSLGIQRITSALPDPVYALLSGLNAATVGIVALAAVQLSQKAITDKLTRILVAFGGIAGMLYTALWYFPVLMATGGVVTLVWDLRLPHNIIQRINRRFGQNQEQQLSSITTNTDIELNSEGPIEQTSQAEREGPRIVPQGHDITIMSLGTGWLLLASFTLSFIALMVTRGVFRHKAIVYNVFANLYLAGTIIFGGGPVVIPLLREYIVNEGWVSPRDFLLGLALIQAFPGPNFNFAVYLGALAIYNQTNLPSVLGAVLGFVAIFLPGIWVQTAFLAFWRILRGKRWFRCLLRGLHATAVGLVYTAVYRLWQIGLLSKDSQAGSPLANDPWWVAVSVTSFVGGMWFDLSTPLAILLGGVMGLVWYGIVKA